MLYDLDGNNGFLFSMSKQLDLKKNDGKGEIITFESFFSISFFNIEKNMIVVP